MSESEKVGKSKGKRGEGYGGPPSDKTEFAAPALALCRELIEICDRRLAGTACCRMVSERLADEFGKRCKCGSVFLEKFSFHPKPFLKHLKAVVVLCLLGFVALLLKEIYIAWIPFVLGTFMFFTEFGMYKEYFDFLWKKAEGYNVVCRIPANGVPRRRIILGAHHDAPYTFNLLEISSYFYAVVVAISMLYLFGFTAYSLYAAIYTFVTGELPLLVTDPPILIYIIGVIMLICIWFFTSSRVSPGAGDNLISSSLLTVISEYICRKKEEDPDYLSDTEIMLVSFDAEESGLRGSRAFVKRHMKELKEIGTFMLNIDGIYRLDSLRVIVSDLDGFVKLDGELTELCIKIAEDLGYDNVSSMKVFFGTGATDAATFSQAGIRSTCLFAIPRNFSEMGGLYHSINDIPDVIEPEVVEAAGKIAVRFIEKIGSSS